MRRCHVCQSQTRSSVAGWSMKSVAYGAFGPQQTYHQKCSPALRRSSARA